MGGETSLTDQPTARPPSPRTCRPDQRGCQRPHGHRPCHHPRCPQAQLRLRCGRVGQGQQLQDEGAAAEDRHVQGALGRTGFKRQGFRCKGALAGYRCRGWELGQGSGSSTMDVRPVASSTDGGARTLPRQPDLLTAGSWALLDAGACCVVVDGAVGRQERAAGVLPLYALHALYALYALYAGPPPACMPWTPTCRPAAMRPSAHCRSRLFCGVPLVSRRGRRGRSPGSRAGLRRRA